MIVEPVAADGPWDCHSSSNVKLSEGGMVATHVGSDGTFTLVTREANPIRVGERDVCVTFTIKGGSTSYFRLGFVRPGLEPRDKDYAVSGESRAWWMNANSGRLFRSGNWNGQAGALRQGDRLTVVLTAEGRVRFGVNGKEHGPGLPAGSIESGTVVVPAVQMRYNGQSVKLEAGTGAGEVPAWAR